VKRNLRVEVVDSHCGVVLNFDVNLSNFSRDVTVLVNPRFDADGASRNAAQSTHLSGLVVMLWSNGSIELGVDDQVLLGDQVVLAVGLEHGLDLVRDLCLKLVAHLLLLLLEDARKTIGKAVLEGIRETSRRETARIVDDGVLVLEEVAAGMVLVRVASPLGLSVFLIGLLSSLLPEHLLVSLDGEVETSRGHGLRDVQQDVTKDGVSSVQP